MPRPNAARLLQGRGTFTDDLRFPRLAHVAFFRSPYAHARIKKLDFSKALNQPGVIGIFDGRAVAEYCKPWVAVLAHLKGIKSPRQPRHGGGGGTRLLAGRGVRGGCRSPDPGLVRCEVIEAGGELPVVVAWKTL